MGYPPNMPPGGGYPQGPPPGYGPPAQPGYGQQPAPGYGGPPPPGYGYGPPAPGGYGQPGADDGFDFGQSYQTADTSAGLMPDSWQDAIVTEREYGRTKAGDKWCWTVQFQITTGQYTGRKLTTTLAVSPRKQDGTQNDQGMGILYRHLGALGVPVGEKFGGQPGEQPWFTQAQGSTPAERALAAGQMACQYMANRPCYIHVTQNTWSGGTNNKIADIKPARAGAPAQAPAQPGPGAAPPPQQQPAFGGYQPGPPAPGYPQQPPQPVQGPPPGYPPQQAAPPPQAPPAPGPAAPMQPGQPGVGQFTGPGQAQQGPPNGQPQQPSGVPPAPPWAQPPAQ